MQNLTAQAFLSMSQADLDALYCRSQIGTIPTGDTRGTAIIAPKTVLAKILAPLARLLFWQGKSFNAERGDLLNFISPFHLKAIRAKTYIGDSWLMNGRTIVLDYSRTSFVAHKVRDEIREVSPGLYLGKVFWGRKHLLDFALETGDRAR